MNQSMTGKNYLPSHPSIRPFETMAMLLPLMLNSFALVGSLQIFKQTSATPGVDNNFK
jgi:hypothetical protein